jgi:hypothetical protein
MNFPRFADTEGILDWYHASEHVWAWANELHADPQKKMEILVLHRPAGHRTDADVQKIFKGLPATDPAALRGLLDQIEDRLGFVVEKLFLGHGERGEGKGVID